MNKIIYTYGIDPNINKYIWFRNHSRCSHETFNNRRECLVSIGNNINRVKDFKKSVEIKHIILKAPSSKQIFVRKRNSSLFIINGNFRSIQSVIKAYESTFGEQLTNWRKDISDKLLAIENELIFRINEHYAAQCDNYANRINQKRSNKIS